MLLWALHFLPLPLLARLGRGLGAVLYRAGRSRRAVARTNLRLCFPAVEDATRERWLREHFALFGRSFLERALTWWSSPARLKKLIHLQGREHLEALAGQPVVLMAPHFVGLDMAWARLTLEQPMAGMYANQKNPVFNRQLLAGRKRFGSLAISRQEGVLRAVRAIREGRPFYYLPDMDYGPRDAVFVPFFGVPCATITALSRLARLGRAQVLPVITEMLPGGQGYRVTIGAPWADFPSEDVSADTARMNAFIEQQVLRMPAQYYWLHKRFKTRPAGDAGFYD
jgi:KDO2-lipid IV(A) lauroyltransferase